MGPQETPSPPMCVCPELFVLLKISFCGFASIKLLQKRAFVFVFDKSSGMQRILSAVTAGECVLQVSSRWLALHILATASLVLRVKC